MTGFRDIAAGDPATDAGIPTLLFAFLGAPVLWALHLNAVYFLVTLDCISGWGGAGWAVLVTTLVCAAGAAASGWVARAVHRRLPRGEDSQTGGGAAWTRFLMVLGMGAAVLFTLVILLEGASPLFADFCA